MNKREHMLLAMLLAAFMSVSMAACGDTDASSSAEGIQAETTTTAAGAADGSEATTTTESAEPEKEPDTTTIDTAEPASEPETTTTTAEEEPAPKAELSPEDKELFDSIKSGKDICVDLRYQLTVLGLDIDENTLAKDLETTSLKSSQDIAQSTVGAGLFSTMPYRFLDEDNDLEVSINPINPTDKEAAVAELPFYSISLASLSKAPDSTAGNDSYTVVGGIKLGDGLESVYETVGAPLIFQYRDDGSSIMTYSFADKTGKVTFSFNASKILREIEYNYKD